MSKCPCCGQIKVASRGGVTARQYRVLDFIGAYIDESKISPSFEDIRVGCSLSSKSNVSECVDALEQRGLLVKWRDMARAITLTPAGREVISRPTSKQAA